MQSEQHPPKVRVTVVIQDRRILETDVLTGKRLREELDIPAGFSLKRRLKGDIQSINDEDSVEVRDGDHFFAQPLEEPGLGHTVR